MPVSLRHLNVVVPENPQASNWAPANFFYAHFHNGIRSELDLLEARVCSLEPAADDVGQRLSDLKEHCSFLEQLYKYHSVVEDEVVYPALDAKVRNVTLFYSVEHEEEGTLFEQLSQLISTTIQQQGAARADSIKHLAYKVEEVQTTLRQHLAKEEGQLLPLLLAHFSHAEQAELVAQFLYCIPLATIEKVLAWLKSRVPQAEQELLLCHVRSVVPDTLLLQLLVRWLQPVGPTASREHISAQLLAGAGGLGPPPAQEGAAGLGPAPACIGTTGAGSAFGHQAAEGDAHTSVASGGAPSPGPSSCDSHGSSECGQAGLLAVGLKPGLDSVGTSASILVGRPPLQSVSHLHRSICSALESFVREAKSLLSQVSGEVTAAQLSSLVERQRFLRAVCMFHRISEDEVVLPEIRRLRFADGLSSAPSDTSSRMDSSASGAAALAACEACSGEHATEVAMFDDLGRRLGDLRALVRRGRKEVLQLLQQMVDSAVAACTSITSHMAREEVEVLSVLQLRLPAASQCAMVWSMLRAMPLRLLERVMPWVFAKLTDEDAAELLAVIRAGAPPSDMSLVELLSRWAQRGRMSVAGDGAGSTGMQGALEDDDPRLYSNATCHPHGPSSHLDAVTQGDLASAWAATRHAAPQAGTPGRLDSGRPDSKRRRLSAGSGVAGTPGEHTAWHGEAGHATATSSAQAAAPSRPPARPTCTAQAAVPAGAQGFNPIDHIFQFHKALRQELRQLEVDAACVERHAGLAAVVVEHCAVPEADHASGVAAAAREPEGEATAAAEHVQQAHASSLSAQLTSSVQQLDGRFQFLLGIYRAHSRAEDEIVFPALESKEALHNVSHAYTLDHQQEEELLEELKAVIERLRRSCKWGTEFRELSVQVCRMCAALRAAIETHIRAEESELWPLFVEHFSPEEQQYLVGVIIGRTGATVLQALLPFVSESVTPEEKDAMMESLRGATKNTMFDQWLGAIQVQGSGGVSGRTGSGPLVALDAPGGPVRPPALVADATAAIPATEAGQGHLHSEQPELSGQPRALTEVARYLTGELPGTTAESTSFRPGWEDIFRMNQKQLEANIRKVSNDPNLEPKRKAYLIQNILVSKYIVAQQKRMGPTGGSTSSSAPMTPAPEEHAHRAPQEPVLSAALATAAGGALLGAAAPAASGGAEGGDGCGAGQCTYHPGAPGVLGCSHYRRKARLVAPCCNQIHTCRLCHDDVNDHRMDRYAVSEMVCMECQTRQPVAAACSACGCVLSAYYCGICHLFDDEPNRDIYHCPFCNTCRRGKGLGVDFFHCMHCNACMSLSLFNSHKCRERCMEGNCPVCNEYLFDSSLPIKELPCGHLMHSSCFAAHTRYHYTCPLCSRSIGDLSVYFQMLDSLLASEQLPAEYAGRTQQVLCHDCGKMGFAPYHFVYHACPHCRSYNTRVL